jgi:hypothetical protein
MSAQKMMKHLWRQTGIRGRQSLNLLVRSPSSAFSCCLHVVSAENPASQDDPPNHLFSVAPPLTEILQSIRDMPPLLMVFLQFYL